MPKPHPNPGAVRTLGVITARGASRGFPRKNVALLLGKPLIAYTIESAKRSKFLTRFIVSTDTEEIAEIARKLGAEVPFLRPEKLATDTATSIAVVQHALQWIKANEGAEYDYVMILQPTSPLRTEEDIDSAITKAAETGADSVMSMVEVQDFSIEKLKMLDGDRIQPLLEKEGIFSNRRDETPNAFKRNTAIYLTKVECIMRGDLFGENSRAYIMPPERSVDINDPMDLKLAEFWMRTLHLHGS